MTSKHMQTKLEKAQKKEHAAREAMRSACETYATAFAETALIYDRIERAERRAESA